MIKMKVKIFSILVVGFLFIHFYFFCVPVFAVAPSVGIGVPFGNLPVDEQNIFLNAANKLIDDIFGLSGEKEIVYVDPLTGEQFVGNKEEINNLISSLANERVWGHHNDNGDIIYFEYSDEPVTTVPAPELAPTEIITNTVCDITKESYDSNVSFDEKYNLAQFIKVSSHVYYDTLKQVYIDLSKKPDDPIYGPQQPPSFSVDLINGVPQNVTTIKQDSYISVFDTLGLEYTVAPSLLDFQFNVLTNNRYVPGYGYTPYFITSDNKLYLFHANIYTGYNGDNNLLFYSFSNGMNTSLSYSISYNFHYTGRFSFRFVDNSGHLYFCLLSSSYISKNNKLNYVQCTHGRPDVSNAPLLFYDYRDGLEAPVSAELNTDFKNYIMPDGYDISFVFSVDKSDVLTDSAILSSDIIAAGYFYGDKDSIGYNSSILNSAGQMLLSSDEIVSGGDKTVSTDLNDWQKAIYVLAHQQGISFEEMLKKLDILIDSNGEITLLGLDGLEYSVSELSKQFDEIIGAVGDISGDLSKLLEYLKSLNIEGLESYISSIDGTLNDLNERDKDTSAVLGSMGDTLSNLKSSVKSIDENEQLKLEKISSIENILDRVQEREQKKEDFDEFMAAIVLEQQANNFKLYDQCKAFLNNLFNYSDHNNPPSFKFYYDSNNDGTDEVYTLLDLSFLNTVLTNENMVDKSFWAQPIRLIDFIRYVIAIVCYGLFVMRLIKRLPSFYGNGPLSFLG